MELNERVAHACVSRKRSMRLRGSREKEPALRLEWLMERKYMAPNRSENMGVSGSVEQANGDANSAVQIGGDFGEIPPEQGIGRVSYVAQ